MTRKVVNVQLVVLTGESVEKLKPKQHNHKISIFVEKVENQMGKTRITPMAWKAKENLEDCIVGTGGQVTELQTQSTTRTHKLP